MRVFKLELPKNLEWMVNSYTTPELKNEFKIMIKEDEELLALLENLLENPYKVIYTKLVGFFGERKVYTFRRESFIVKEVVDSFIDLVDEIKKHKTILDFFSSGCGEDFCISLHTITFIKICIDQ